MHGVNPDLLRALVPHHPDGRPKDPHAHHRATHRAALAEERAKQRLSKPARLIAVLRGLARLPTVSRT